MQRSIVKMAVITAVLSGAMVLGAASTQAGGYKYVARSFYVTPPMYAGVSVFTPQPIVVYEPVVTYPAPVAGYYAPLSTPAVASAPAARVRERQVSSPFRTKYRYNVEYPGGLEYKYQYKVGPWGNVRFKEKWDD